MPSGIKEPGMNATAICEQLYYHGDSVHPSGAEHDLRALVAEAVSRLPKDVQDWLLYETTHVFLGGSGQDEEYINIFVPPNEMKEGFINLRVIFLSEQLMDFPKDDVLWTIAHEVAHSRLDHGVGGHETEVDADQLVQEWGFDVPNERAAEREHCYGKRSLPIGGSK